MVRGPHLFLLLDNKESGCYIVFRRRMVKPLISPEDIILMFVRCLFMAVLTGVFTGGG